MTTKLALLILVYGPRTHYFLDDDKGELRKSPKTQSALVPETFICNFWSFIFLTSLFILRWKLKIEPKKKLNVFTIVLWPELTLRKIVDDNIHCASKNITYRNFPHSTNSSITRDLLSLETSKCFF